MSPAVIMVAPACADVLKIRLAGRFRGSKIEFRILGPLTAALDGRPLALGAPKQRAVLAKLLLARGAVVPRDTLVDAVWGEQPPEAAGVSLQVYVHGLRKALGADRIERHGDGYRVRVEAGELDVERCEQLVQRARAALAADEAASAADDVGKALGLFIGPALADLAGQPVARHVGELEELRLQALELRIEAELALGRHEAVLAELEVVAREHPYRERFRELQILALYRAGRQKEALDAYRDARRSFVDNLGVEPGRALRELEQAVLRQDPALAAPEREAPGRARLPTPATPLIGRALEIAAVAALLRRAGTRLVTLTGPGGSGKTRLAIAAAAELARELAGGAVFVDLASTHDQDALAREVAKALGVEDADDPLSAAVTAVGTRPLLLVLDNLEQLLQGVAPIVTLLARAPRLLILATSRAPLRLSGEHEYQVPPLPVPSLSARFEEVAEADAVRLFLARARAVRPDFALTDENAPAVASVCRRLDGLPLALELAAVWTRLLPADDLARRLGGALELLVEGARDLPPRQRTLRATLDWSYGLLGEEDRRALARLAVFSGGASLDAAQEVLGERALATVARLVEHGLVRSLDDQGVRRLVLLETIREYASERLRASGEEDEVRRLHAHWFRAFSERLEPDLAGADVEGALAEYDREYQNLRGALDWAADAGDVETEVRIAVGLRLYWAVRGSFAEGRRLFERVIANSVGKPSLHVEALSHGAAFAFRRGDLETARAEWTQALDLCRRLGNGEEAARCIAELGGVALAEGNLDEAERHYRAAAAAFAAQGRTVREAVSRGNLASIAAERGDWRNAETIGKQVVELQRSIGDSDGLTVSLYNLARVKLALGSDADARALVDEALEGALQLGYREVIGYALGLLAELALADREHELTARLLGRSDAIFSELSIVRYGEDAVAYERVATELARQLGAERLTDLRLAGAATELEHIVHGATTHS
jgi:predicted ATPase/DNA-binding SARP family transcriptional activator